jgi:hypothetical protein
MSEKNKQKIIEFLGVRVEYDKEGQFIWCIDKNEGHQKLADLRGWGAIQNLFINKDQSIDLDAAANFQDELGLWIVDAINDKLKQTHDKEVAELRQKYLDKVQFMGDAADISANNILHLHKENERLKAEIERLKREKNEYINNKLQ